MKTNFRIGTIFLYRRYESTDTEHAEDGVDDTHSECASDISNDSMATSYTRMETQNSFTNNHITMGIPHKGMTADTKQDPPSVTPGQRVLRAGMQLLRGETRGKPPLTSYAGGEGIDARQEYMPSQVIDGRSRPVYMPWQTSSAVLKTRASPAISPTGSMLPRMILSLITMKCDLLHSGAKLPPYNGFINVM